MPNALPSVVLDVVGSTNTEAFQRAAAGEPGPLWIMARRQTEGRGRSGRSWASEAGNLHASLLQKVACPPSCIHQLSLLAGVAVVDALRAAAGPGRLAGLRLKWPNDVLIGEAKCAGILPESTTGPGSQITAVIGIGINLAWHPADLGRPATHLAAHGVEITPEAMLERLAPAMARWLEAWDSGQGFAQVRTAWLARSGPIGERLTVNAGNERIEGAFLDLASNGALILRDNHGLQRQLMFGDVALAPAVSREGG